MNNNATASGLYSSDVFHYYRDILKIMETSRIPFLIGGGFAFCHYTGIVRYTKDLDLFVRPADVQTVLAVCAAAGYRTELVFSHWLAKVYCSDDFVDVIFSSGNGLCAVDDTWFEHAEEGEVMGTAVQFMSAVEMIWQKAYIMERERFDGADVMHLLRARGRQLNWQRLLARFGSHWRILLSHLILFGFVYPDDGESVPAGVLHALTDRLRAEPAGAHEAPLCQGTLLSRTQYLHDTEVWGYADPRRHPLGTLTDEQLRRWTDAGR
jgi:hypothetical protein